MKKEISIFERPESLNGYDTKQYLEACVNSRNMKPPAGMKKQIPADVNFGVQNL